MSLLCQLQRRIAQLETQSGTTGVDRFVNGGRYVGNTLVLSLSTGGTINIPLQVGGAIDFTNLTDAQCQALSDQLRGDTINNAFGEFRGYLLRK